MVNLLRQIFIFFFILLGSMFFTQLLFDGQFNFSWEDIANSLLSAVIIGSILGIVHNKSLKKAEKNEVNPKSRIICQLEMDSKVPGDKIFSQILRDQKDKIHKLIEHNPEEGILKFITKISLFSPGHIVEVKFLPWEEKTKIIIRSINLMNLESVDFDHSKRLGQSIKEALAA